MTKYYSPAFIILLFTFILMACTKEKIVYSSYEEYPIPTNANLWIAYSSTSTTFTIWSPTAEEVQLKLYADGNNNEVKSVEALKKSADGIWSIAIAGDLNGTYYTYQTRIDGQWLEETPGIYAQAVGVNGKRGMVLDLAATNPDGWNTDKGPTLTTANEAIIYELHIRDMTIHASAGSTFPGTYAGLTETGTKGPENISTGIDHLKELGITHVHLLPTFDHYAIDEANLDSAQFNWGYDPNNYNVPEGSFSSDPFHAEVRIKEFKKMVKAFHDNGIGVILDVVYNHTGRTENSNFNLEVPGYYYRHWEDGRLSDAAACGNETASERAMMRNFMMESVTYWAKEYHVDGFRFDLMGIHDMTTMNMIADSLKAINPNMILYGEGWAAGDSPFPYQQRALKPYMQKMPKLIAFSDDIRDGIKGSVFENESTGFVSGAPSMEETMKFGIVGSIQHPQIDYSLVNYSKAPWTSEPWQAISYVSCHDNHTLYDKLKVSRPDASEADIIAMDKLANAIVMTSQGTAFLHAGAEMLRTKQGEHNSYNLPDSINQIDWNWKIKNKDVITYYKNLIALRKSHPALRMKTAAEVQKHLVFKYAENGLLSYEISGYANGDSWAKILVIYNATNKKIPYQIDEEWKVAVWGNDFDFTGNKKVSSQVVLPAISMVVLYQY